MSRKIYVVCAAALIVIVGLVSQSDKLLPSIRPSAVEPETPHESVLPASGSVETPAGTALNEPRGESLEERLMLAEPGFLPNVITSGRVKLGATAAEVRAVDFPFWETQYVVPLSATQAVEAFYPLNDFSRAESFLPKMRLSMSQASKYLNSPNSVEEIVFTKWIEEGADRSAVVRQFVNLCVHSFGDPDEVWQSESRRKHFKYIWLVWDFQNSGILAMYMPDRLLEEMLADSGELSLGRNPYYVSLIIGVPSRVSLPERAGRGINFRELGVEERRTYFESLLEAAHQP